MVHLHSVDTLGQTCSMYTAPLVTEIGSTCNIPQGHHKGARITVADPEFPVEGRPPRRKASTPNAANLYVKTKESGSLGVAPGAPPGSATALEQQSAVQQA